MYCIIVMTTTFYDPGPRRFYCSLHVLLSADLGTDGSPVLAAQSRESRRKLSPDGWKYTQNTQRTHEVMSRAGDSPDAWRKSGTVVSEYGPVSKAYFGAVALSLEHVHVQEEQDRWRNTHAMHRDANNHGTATASWGKSRKVAFGCA